jgi:hypothetical protein
MISSSLILLINHIINHQIIAIMEREFDKYLLLLA